MEPSGSLQNQRQNSDNPKNPSPERVGIAKTNVPYAYTILIKTARTRKP
jgi:hypothetical protein